jgi:excisionase family DNA binding protein
MQQIERRKSPNATLQQAADYLSVSARTVQNLQTRGVLGVVYLGKRRLFRWSELERIARKGVPLARAAEVEEPLR